MQARFRRIQIRATANALLLWAWVAPTQAVQLNVIEMLSISGSEKSFVQVKDLVRIDSLGGVQLNLFPDINPEHSHIVSILSPGIPFGDEAVRKELAVALVAYPKEAQVYLTLWLEVSPMEHIRSFVPGAKDLRRITGVAVDGYLKNTPQECLYDILQTGALEFTIGMLMGVLRECRIATQAAIDRGEPYADAVYAAHPESKKRPDSPVGR